MIEQAAAFLRTLGHDGSMAMHFRLTNVKGWHLSDEDRLPLLTTDVDIRPLTAGASKAERGPCFRIYATRLFNHFGMPACNLLSEDATPTSDEGGPLESKNLPRD